MARAKSGESSSGKRQWRVKRIRERGSRIGSASLTNLVVALQEERVKK